MKKICKNCAYNHNDDCKNIMVDYIKSEINKCKYHTPTYVVTDIIGNVIFENNQYCLKVKYLKDKIEVEGMVTSHSDIELSHLKVGDEIFTRLFIV